MDNPHVTVEPQGENSFLLSWGGDRTPRGARVGNHTIGWTQHGNVKDSSGERIGFYERLVDNYPTEHKMLVTLI